MQTIISSEHKLELQRIGKSLTTIGSAESNFPRVEILFYDVLTLARQYGEDPKQNNLLAALQELKEGSYQKTKAFFKKSTQCESAIRRFINQFRSLLIAATAKGYATSNA